MLEWLAEALVARLLRFHRHQRSAATANEMAPLEAEDNKLQAEIEKLKVVADDAVHIIKTLDPPHPEAPEANAKAKKVQKRVETEIKKEKLATEEKLAIVEKAAAEGKAAAEEQPATEPPAEKPAGTVAATAVEGGAAARLLLKLRSGCPGPQMSDCCCDECRVVLGGRAVPGACFGASFVLDHDEYSIYFSRWFVHFREAFRRLIVAVARPSTTNASTNR